MDEIRIDNLEIYAGHGVYAQENAQGQPFFVNAVLYTDTRKAGREDELAFSTHYGEAAHLINQYLREHTFRLIEAAAENAAEQILLRFPLVRSLELELCKPRAPIGLPFSSVSVKISRGWKRAYLSVGSNMGNRREYIERAVRRMEENPKIRCLRCSDLIVTPPYGGVEQEDFLNGAVELETLYFPDELLRFLQSLEEEEERVRTVRWGPRTLDLDILFFEDFVSDDPSLTVPHPDLHNRRFVLEPLSGLCPYLRHPVLGKSIRQLYEELGK